MGSEKRRRIEKVKAARDPLGTPRVATTEERSGPDRKARAKAKIDADTQVESQVLTLESSAGRQKTGIWTLSGTSSSRRTACVRSSLRVSPERVRVSTECESECEE